MTTTPAPAASPDPIAAYLDEAKATLGDALKAHGIDRVTAQIRKQGDTFLVTALTEHVGTAEPAPLRATLPITSGKGEHHGAFDSLTTFITHYVATLLTHRPERFLCDGRLTIWAWGHVALPIDWNAKFAQDSEDAKKVLGESKLPIIAALKTIGVHSVIIAYDGEGDSGQLESITAHTADNTEVDLNVAYVGPENDAQSSTLRDAIDDLAWECIGACHEGFENNEGGYGEITIDVVTGTITVDHNDRIIEVSNTVTEV